MSPAPQAPRPVALVSMPTTGVDTPSLPLALLQATLEQAGWSVECHSLFIHFGQQIGFELNEKLGQPMPSMVGEWLWARAAFGDFADDQDYFRRYGDNLEQYCGCSREALLDLRDRAVPAFLDFCLESIDWSRYQLVGFSILFQQVLASLALARRLKERYPALPILLGGGLFEDEIAQELLRACPWVDLIHCGEADETFPELLRRLGAGESLLGLPGFAGRRDGEIVFGGRAPIVRDLDRSPAPDYREFFATLEECGRLVDGRLYRTLLPFEASRGCWWGVKHHCTFCGQNRGGMEYRAKRVPETVRQLALLVQRHGIFRFNAIDTVMPHEYVEELFAELDRSCLGLSLHYDVRCHLTRGQLARMKAAGLDSIQPGIESLSTHVLQLMNKGHTAVQNLQFLKWCAELDIDNYYNILFGFAGETAKDYEEMRALIAKIPHLPPPYGVARARADRGSPMFTRPAEHAITALRPWPVYRHLYPPDRIDLSRVAYFFDHDVAVELPLKEHERLEQQLLAWQQRWARKPRPFLRFRRAWDLLHVEDGRREPVRYIRYRDEVARLYEFCQAQARSRRAVAEQFPGAGDPAWIDEALQEFQERDLLVHLDERYIGLASPVRPIQGPRA